MNPPPSARWVITEVQSVLAIREIEAADEDAALEAFWRGEGREVGRDGEVTSSQLVSVERSEA